MLMVCAACQTRAPRPAEAQSHPATIDLDASYSELARSGAGRIFRLDPAASKLRIYVFRGGKAAKAGHNHVLTAPEFEGYAHLAETVAASRFDLRLRLDELVIDDPAVREQTGGNFSGERSAADIEGTRRNMLGVRGLDAAGFPFIHLRSESVAGDWPILVAEVAITIKDRTRVQPLTIRVERSDDGMRAYGEWVLRHTDFGIEPYSVLGGLLAVQDSIAIEFDLGGVAARFD